MSSTADTAGGTVRSPVAAVATAETGWQGRPATPWRRHVGDDAPHADDDLLLALTEGDTATFAALYDRLAGLVAHNLHRLLGDASPPQEVIRSTFLEVCRDTSDFDPTRSSAETWVLTTLYRQVTGLAPADLNGPAPTDEPGS